MSPASIQQIFRKSPSDRELGFRCHLSGAANTDRQADRKISDVIFRSDFVQEGRERNIHAPTDVLPILASGPNSVGFGHSQQ